jgi:enoyl-CoA hydratase
LLFLGETIDAQEAYRIGLANRIVEPEKLIQQAYELARRLKQQTLHALGVTKELLEREANMDLERALTLEATAQAGCMETADFREGYRAFVEKRSPVFNRS